jgi:hypothetical protein
MTILVVEGALLTSVFMHPKDHICDRSACLFIAFLILVTNMQVTCRCSGLLLWQWHSPPSLHLLHLLCLLHLLRHLLLRVPTLTVPTLTTLTALHFLHPLCRQILVSAASPSSSGSTTSTCCRSSVVISSNQQYSLLISGNQQYSVVITWLDCFSPLHVFQ